jgi:hypothetical protein
VIRVVATVRGAELRRDLTAVPERGAVASTASRLGTAAMIETIVLYVNAYIEYYRQTFLSQWNGMSPLKYGGVLISIGVFGWLLMRSGPKRI